MRRGFLDRVDHFGQRGAARGHRGRLQAGRAQRGQRAPGVQHLDGDLVVAFGHHRRGVRRCIGRARLERVDEAEHVLGALVRLAVGGEKIRRHRSGDDGEARLARQAPVEFGARELVVAEKFGGKGDLDGGELDAELRGLGDRQVGARITNNR